MEQLSLFDLISSTAASYVSTDFVEMSGNREALSFINSWPKLWRDNALLLIGPGDVGKTHLAKMWQSKTGAVEITVEVITTNVISREGELFDLMEHNRCFFVDLGGVITIEDILARGLLSVMNIAKEVGVWLLIVARSEFIENIQLQDLRSRINAMQCVCVENSSLNDDQLLALLCKNMSDHQLSMAANEYGYILPRINRSIGSVKRFCELADEYLKRHPGKLNRSGVRRILAGLLNE